MGDIESMIRVIWILYRRAKWKYLADLGLERGKVERVFTAFDMRYIVSEVGLITSRAQCLALMKMYPEILEAAVELQRHYAEGTYV